MRIQLIFLHLLLFYRKETNNYVGNPAVPTINANVMANTSIIDLVPSV
jgi:hypothetical protein